MARKDRMGQRKTRAQRLATRIPELGYYMVVTDTEATERLYFNGMRDSLPEEMKGKLVIKVFETETGNLVGKCKELTAYESQYRIPWIVFDRDQVVNFDQIIQDAENAGINVGWSNPCFEIWLFGYFKNIPSVQESWSCVNQFADLYKKQTGHTYEKSDKDIYDRICRAGDEEQAIKRSSHKYNQMLKNGISIPSQMCPCSKVYELVDEINRKIRGDRKYGKSK